MDLKAHGKLSSTFSGEKICYIICVLINAKDENINRILWYVNQECLWFWVQCPGFCLWYGD